MNAPDRDSIAAWNAYRKISRSGIILIPGLWVLYLTVWLFVPDLLAIIHNFARYPRNRPPLR
jgi:hypothetical protein